MQDEHKVLNLSDKCSDEEIISTPKLEKKGTPIGPYDLLIGGTALLHQATLVSHNTTEFERIDKLQLEDWYY